MAACPTHRRATPVTAARRAPPSARTTTRRSWPTLRRRRRATWPPAPRRTASSGSTGGTWGPSPSGPDPHFHKTISESFYVLVGGPAARRAGWLDATAGDFLYVPEGGIHGFRNESGEPASMLILFAPGAPREDYFETLADAARREAMDEEARQDFYLRHDTYWI